MDINQDNVLLVEFSPSPCVELKRISMKLFPSQVKKNFFFKKKIIKKKKLSKLIKKVPNDFTKTKSLKLGIKKQNFSFSL